MIFKCLYSQGKCIIMKLPIYKQWPKDEIYTCQNINVVYSAMKLDPSFPVPQYENIAIQKSKLW